jgi:DNA-nicking Smr family endonuclease
MTAGDDKRRQLTDEEQTLWQGVTKSVTPLVRPRKKSVATSEADGPAPDAVAAKRPPNRKPSSPPVARPVARSALAPAVLAKREKQRLARGVEAIDARLDLHGKTQSQAHGALLRFLRRAQADGARYVLVITGKGVRGDDERGVLKRQVPLWLAQPEFRAFVVGFEDAHIGHGGEGALYVRVRRARG